MGRVLDYVIEQRNGHYVHALEIQDVEDLKSCLEGSYGQLIEKFTHDEVAEFLNSVEIYCLNNKFENEVHEFSVSEFVEGLKDS